MRRLFKTRTRSAPVEAPEPAAPPPAEGGELADRLRKLDWPAPDPEVRERCLERIMERVEDDGALAPGRACPDHA